MPSDFAAYIDALNVSRPIELPLVHTTESQYLHLICRDGKLEPQPCSIFEIRLIYFFYGRPAYHRKFWSRSTGPQLSPVCFVLKPNCLATDYHSIYPFDSGAAHGNMFSPYIEGADLKDFQLSNIASTLGTLSNHFFASNADYFDAKPAGVDLPTSTPANVAKYVSLISHYDSVDYDHRRSAIEITVRNAVELKDKLMTIVLPFAMLQDATIRRVILEEWGLRPLTYNTAHGQIVSEYVGVIKQRVRDFLDGSHL